MLADRPVNGCHSFKVSMESPGHLLSSHSQLELPILSSLGKFRSASCRYDFGDSPLNYISIHQLGGPYLVMQCPMSKTHGHSFTK